MFAINLPHSWTVCSRKESLTLLAELISLLPKLPIREDLDYLTHIYSRKSDKTVIFKKVLERWSRKWLLWIPVQASRKSGDNCRIQYSGIVDLGLCFCEYHICRSSAIPMYWPFALPCKNQIMLYLDRKSLPEVELIYVYGYRTFLVIKLPFRQL
jgi:hypothetical protein